MKITRTLITVEAVAVELEYKQGQAFANEIGRVQFEGTSATKAAARKAFAAAGIEVPRGCPIEFTEVRKTTYGVEVEDFMRIATPIKTEENA